MTQYVNVIGVGPVGFPDDMTKEQITEILKTMPPPVAALATGGPSAPTAERRMVFRNGRFEFE